MTKNPVKNTYIITDENFCIVESDPVVELKQGDYVDLTKEQYKRFKNKVKPADEEVETNDTDTVSDEELDEISDTLDNDEPEDPSKITKNGRWFYNSLNEKGFATEIEAEENYKELSQSLEVLEAENNDEVEDTETD